MYNKRIIFTSILLGSLVVFGHSALATSVNRMFVTNLEGYPGQTVKQEIVLEGTDPGERSGYWYSHYKKTEGDGNEMDITSWITINPKEFSIKEKEKKSFIIEVKIPKNIEPGLWGATTEDAGKEGHSGERRTYVVFKDALGEGNVYSGLMLPISIKVLPSQNPFANIMLFIEENKAILILSSIIFVLLAIIFFKRRKISN